MCSVDDQKQKEHRFRKEFLHLNFLNVMYHCSEHHKQNDMDPRGIQVEVDTFGMKMKLA